MCTPLSPSIWHDMTWHLSLIPTIFRFLTHVCVGGPLVAIITYIHRGFIEMAHQYHCKINADIRILDKSLIIGLSFCVFVGYSVRTYANDSLTYWLLDKIMTITWRWKTFFMTRYVKYNWKFTNKCTRFHRFFGIYPCLHRKFSILKHVDDD